VDEPEQINQYDWPSKKQEQLSIENALLPDHKWKLKYTPDDGNLVQLFMSRIGGSQSYHRSTGYFGATALTWPREALRESSAMAAI